MNYLIIVCGYEGIERIIGLFDKETATSRMKQYRQTPHDEWTSPLQYCVQYVDENGSRCACAELGVSMKGAWMY